ncbi:hypothetical protein WH47_01292, partial [Habropoda laboriosa]
NNAPVRSVVLAKEFFKFKIDHELKPPLYSLDLSPSDFSLFPRVKSVVKGTHFQSVSEIHCNVCRLKVSTRNVVRGMGLMLECVCIVSRGLFSKWLHICLMFEIL